MLQYNAIIQIYEENSVLCKDVVGKERNMLTAFLGTCGYSLLLY